MTESPEATPRTRTTAIRRVGVFGLLVVAAGLGVLWLGVVPLATIADRPFTLPWPLIAAAFYVTEVNVIHLHFRRETQAFSLNEIPLVIGLFYSDPVPLVASAVLGAIAALVFVRRQRGVKLAVNAGHVLLATTVAVVAFRAIAQPVDGLAWLSWLAAGAAALVAISVNVAVIFAAISLSEGRSDYAKLWSVASASYVGAITTASLALVAVALMWVTPLAVTLVIVPAGVIFLAFRAYTSEKEKHESLEFLYASARILQEAPEVNEAVTSLLAEAQKTFRSEVAEATIYPADPAEPVLRARVVLDGPHEELAPMVETDHDVRFREAIQAGASAIVLAGEGRNPRLEAYLDERGYRDAMVTPLRGETRIIGALLLADRLGQVTTYRDEELRLFETLATNASVSLENTRLERTLTELHALKEELRHRAEHDALTGLANRSLFTQRVEEALAHPGAVDRTVVLYLDLDDFKSVNDTFGHESGDGLLIEVGDRLRRSLRPSDLAARLGGDEFAVLLEDVDDLGLPVTVAERIMASLRYPVRVADRDIVVRSSIGVAVAHAGETSGDVIRNADVAMYRAKHHAKGRYAIFEPGMHQDLADRLELRSQLLSSVDDEQFVVHYQPLNDLVTGAIVGLEALVRWDHPTRGIVPPDEFISLAEETGLVVPIGDLVLRESLRQLAAWQEAFDPGLVMSVNISARQLKHESLVRSVRDAVEASGVDPGSVILEITERDVMDDTESNVEKLAALKAVGVLLAIDDFGTGYSSLAYLRRFPVDVVKIAKPFVDTITRVGDGGVLARAIIELSRALGLSTIAEGIEVGEQADLLRDWHCPVGQGWHFSRAQPAAQIDRELARSRVASGRASLRLVRGGLADGAAEGA